MPSFKDSRGAALWLTLFRCVFARLYEYVVQNVSNWLKN